MKKLSDILLEAENIVLAEEDVAVNSNIIVPPITATAVDRVGNALQKLDQIGAMADDLYNTISHLEEIDAETDAALTGAYNSVDDLYAKIDDKYDVIPIDLEEYEVTEDLEFDTTVEVISEKLSPDAPASEWIDDFVKSDAPQFAGKSKKERIKMALGAYYGAQKNEDVELEEAAETYNLNRAQSFWYKLNKGAVSNIQKDKYLAALQKAIKAGELTYTKDETMAKFTNMADRYDLKFKDKSDLTVWLHDNGAKISGNGNIYSRKGGALFSPEVKPSQIKLAEDVELEESEIPSEFPNDVKLIKGNKDTMKFGLYTYAYSAGRRMLYVNNSPSGDVYRFTLVPQSVYDNMKSAENAGEYYKNHVKGKYNVSRITEDVELEESFRPGHDMVPAPIGKDTYMSQGLRKLWGIKMRAGKWADTFVGMWDDGKIGIINDQGVNKYSSVAEFEKGFAKFRKSGDLDEATTLEEGVNIPKIKELVSLALIEPKDVEPTIAALKASQSDKTLTPAQTKLLGNLAVMLTNVILGDTTVLSSVKRAAKE